MEESKSGPAKFIQRLHNKIWYQLFMAVLAFASGGMLAYEFYGSGVSEEAKNIMNDLDLGIAYIFLTDFAAGLYSSQKRYEHLKKNWLDLASSIPISSGMARTLRIVRFARLIRLLRAGSVGLNIENSVSKLHKRK